MNKTIKLIIGTSKTNPLEEGYYIISAQQNKFWAVAKECGLTKNSEQIKPKEYKYLGTEYNIHITDIVDANYTTKLTTDKNIKLEHIVDGFIELIFQIEKIKPDVIAFNGIKAAKWFKYYIETNKATLKPKSNVLYGKQKFKFHEKFEDLNKIKFIALPSTASSASNCWLQCDGKKQWMEFWKM